MGAIQAGDDQVRAAWRAQARAKKAERPADAGGVAEPQTQPAREAQGGDQIKSFPGLHRR